MATLRRIWHDLQATLSPAAGHLLAIETALATLPADRFARSAKNCRTTAARLDTVRTAAEQPAARSSDGDLAEGRPLLRELAALAAETVERLEATVLLLDDTGRLGTVPEINDALARACVSPPTGAGERSVHVDTRELGPVRAPTTGAGRVRVSRSRSSPPEGATAALVRSHLAQAETLCRERAL
ncbi:hypothetical protein ACWDBD_32030 [Streptomyces sp. NPDC001118]